MRALPLGLAIAALQALACASPPAPLPAPLEIRVEIPPMQHDSSGVYMVSVQPNGWVRRRVAPWDGQLRVESGRRLDAQQLENLRALLGAVNADAIQEQDLGGPLDSNEYLLRYGERWSVRCDEFEAARCPPRFRELWQSLEQILGDLPGP